MDRRAQVTLEPGTLVIGDLHLRVERLASLDPFVDWLEAAEGAPRLVILGDLFEYWIGPAQGRFPGSRRVTDALAALAASGTEIDVIPGNRDFLLDESFESASGARVHRDALIGTTAAGERVLFIHGDELCTEDRGHQRLRAVFGNPVVRWGLLHIPERLAIRAAERLRRESKERRAYKDPESVRLVPATCERLAREHDAGVVICGHAHRFRDDELAGGVRWFVVDAFGGKRDTLELGAELGFAPRV